MIRNREKVIPVLVFALYMFVYMSTLATLNTKAAGIIDDSIQITLYYIDSFAVVVGFFFYHLYNRLKGDDFPTIVAVGFFMTMIMVMIVKTGSLFMILEPLMSFFNGLFGGYIYYFMAKRLYHDPDAGMIMATGNSLAIILQFLFQMIIKASATATLLIDMGILLLFIMLRGRFSINEISVENRHNEKNIAYLLIPCVIVIAMTFLNNYFDSMVEIIMVSSDFADYNIYSWPRLFSCAGFITYGYTHDRFHRKYDGLIILAAALITIINPIVITLNQYVYLGMCLFYVSIAVGISYLNIAFWETSFETDKPALWASMGRIIDGTTLVVLSAFQINRISLVTITIIDVAVIMFIFMLIFRHFFNGTDNNDEPDFQKTKEEYDLTDREMEVFELLVRSDDGVKEIAEKLFVSRRTLQRHISAIYQKFDVNSRSGLIQKCYRRH